MGGMDKIKFKSLMDNWLINQLMVTQFVGKSAHVLYYLNHSIDSQPVG